MRKHAGSAGVQEEGCGALLSLACNDANNIKIGGAGGIELVMGAMGKHAGSAGVQEHGCGALRNLANGNDANKIKI
eukprot:2576807-Rhodomonas_salina.1